MSDAIVLEMVILVSLILYALSGGADFGGGVWDLLASGPRAQRQREAIDHAIAPIWEANHVWLIVVVVVLFSAFPPAFGAIMTALHVPLTLVLVGIVLRAAAFVFRKYDVQTGAAPRRWGRVFGVSSLFTPFLLGLCLGALASGEIRLTEGRVVTGFLAGWTRPFAIGCGLFAQGLFAFLAATYLTVDMAHDTDVRDDFRRRALIAGVLLAPIALLVFLLAGSGAPRVFAGLTDTWAPLLLFATSVAAVAALVALWTRKFRLARAAAAMQVTFILLGWALAQYPFLIVPDLTFTDAAAPPNVLRLLTWVFVAGAIVLAPSFYYLFRVFKGSGAATSGGRADH
jgi:cytochrome d ubiquinol oxidase subunit II